MATTAVGACARSAGTPSLIPIPASARVEPATTFVLDTVADILVSSPDSAAVGVARQLAELIGNTAETTPRVVVVAPGPGAGPSEAVTAPPPEVAAAAQDAPITLLLHPHTLPDLGPEGYRLSVTPEGVRITAAEPAGLFYGTQTLRQLLPASVEYSGARPRPLPVPLAEIEDRPRFGWRGAMLDVARHFLGVEDVKRYIDLLALHKLNRLHLHLADDQGWRIEVPDWPRLTEVGGSTEVGGGPGGFYTTEEYREIVRYAADRFITVVPEIDMPGHTNAALASYPELNCDGVAPDLYTGIRVGFSALCIDREETWHFVEDVIAHLARITPGPWIHIGGDEVEELTEEEYAGFIERVQEIVRRHGKRAVGWGEIAAAELSPHTLIQHWRGSGEELEDVWAGQLILSPSTHVYLDIKYDQATPIGLTWPGLTPLADSYQWSPAALIPGLPENAIAGIEAPVWTETVGSIHDLEFLAFPRLAAVAELAWSPAAELDWQSFRRRVARLGLRWVALGVNFHRSPEIDWANWGRGDAEGR